MPNRRVDVVQHGMKVYGKPEAKNILFKYYVWFNMEIMVRYSKCQLCLRHVVKNTL